MSTDAQPRRRKEKRRKKESSGGDRARAEAEFVARKFSVADDSDEGNSPAPPKPQPPRASPAFGEGDSIIHVDHEGGTGGHWCAKIVFFALLAALMVLIGLIIAENRGLTDLDTPVAESRFAQMFDGWVDEGPLHDDHHDEHTLELKDHDEDHDDEGDEEDGHDEEIEDIESDVEDGGHDDNDEDATPDHDDDEDEDADEDLSNDEDNNDEVDSRENSAEVSQEVDEENDDDDELNKEDNDDNDDDDDNDDNDNDDNDDDDDDNDNDNNIDSIENEDEEEEEEQENLSVEIDESRNKYDEENYNGAEEEEDDDDYINIYRDQPGEDNGSDEKHAANQESTEDILNFSNEDDIEDESKDIPFEEVDSFEEDVVDNTAGEEEHLAAKKAEKLAQEQEESNNMGMRVAVGVALVMVTYCVLARKWRNANQDEDAEDSPTDRRMTLLPDDIQDDNNEENEIEEEIIQSTTSTIQKSQPRIYDKEDIEEIAEFSKPNLQTDETVKTTIATNQEENDEDEIAEEEDDEEVEYEEEEEEPLVKSTDVTLQDSSQTKKEPESDNEEEIEDEEEELVDDDELDEEIVEEEEEEEISEELDDTELMKKLEEKYGKLPDYEDEAEGNSDEEKPVVPARKRPKPTDGNSIEEDNWSVDSNDDWKLQLDLAQAEMDEGKLEDAFRHFTSLSLTNPTCWRAKLGRARTMDLIAETKRNNNILDSAILIYKEVLNMTISRKEFIAVAERTIDRIRFRGQHMDAVNIHNHLIKKFPSNPEYRNQLAITYLMVNKVDLARDVLRSTLKLWPANGVALVHYGFILKTIDNNLEEAVLHMQKGVDTKENGTLEGRFLFHLGDALARLGRQNEASEIYQLGASLKVFLSAQQRSLYNVDRLTGRPWWKHDQTPYVKFFKSLENNWKAIAKEASEIQSHFKLEQENLKDTGHWSQYELFARGVEMKSHCAKCPVTCRIARSEPAAYGCRRGQVKFSAMTPGTHIYAHTGPTNCRLRAHLGLQGTKNTYIRVDKEIRSWEEGKIFIFDDSFEHEVWHNGSLPRIVLIVDLWHPELTKEEKLYLPAI